MERQTHAMVADLHTVVASRRSPGIVILNGLGEVVHVNDTAWEMLSLIRQHAPVSKNGLVPEVMMDLCHELESKLSGRHSVSSHTRLEATHLMATADGGVLFRALALEGANDLPTEGRRFLIMLEKVVEREPVNVADQERFGLTPREREVIQALTHGFTNKEIGNALGITEPTVKAHIKHIMEKM
ncbi:MAG: response regulator transcription factor [Nitrospirales bacterium]|nr:response regulator transcription factor [Nitrospirales bacterium]